MAFVDVTDAAGDSMRLTETVDGYRTCTFFQPAEVVGERVRNLPNFPCLDNDIFICCSAKSGTHWSWEIVSMLLNGNAETVPSSKIEQMIEASDWDHLATLPSPRVLNSHVNYAHLPRELKEKRCKLVFLARNPKDVAVSLYNHCRGIIAYEYDGKWENFLPLFLDGKLEYLSWFDYTNEWEELIFNHPDVPIHFTYYEDFKENNLEEVRRLGKFLGVENKDGLYERISEKCQFKNMVRDKDNVPKSITAFKIKEGFKFYRKGEIGDWKNYFTVAQSELFDSVYADKMKNSNLKFRYEYKKC